MPLSEHEQRLLEQMERALYAEDPKFASSLRGRDPRSNFRRRIALAVLGFILGIVALMAGLVTQLVVLSVLGFVVMLAAAFFAVTSYRQLVAAGRLGVVDTTGAVRRPQQQQQAPSRRGRDHRGLMEKLEERWNKRRDENGR